MVLAIQHDVSNAAERHDGGQPGFVRIVLYLVSAGFPLAKKQSVAILFCFAARLAYHYCP